MSLSEAAVNRANVLVITARSHAAEAQRSIDSSKDWQERVPTSTRSQSSSI